MTDGQKFDTGKIRLDLIAPEFILGVGEILTHGAAKYGERNWEQGIAYGRVFGAVLRHLFAFWKGERLDKESGKPHLWHAATELMFLITYEERNMKMFDGRTSHQWIPEGQCEPRMDGSGGMG